MTRAYYNQEQFNFGRLGPLVRGRRDGDFYRKGAKVMKNFRPTVQGPAVKRKGTRFVGEVKTSANDTRLIPFIFSDDDSVVIELGNLYARFYKNGDILGAPYEIATPYTTADLPLIKYAQLGDIMYLAAGGSSTRPQKLTRLGDTNWTIADVDNRLGPVGDVNETATTINVTGTKTEGGTSSWAASTAIFEAAHVGSVWGIEESSGVIHYARMTTFTSSTQASFFNQTDMTALSGAKTKWHPPLWSGVDGYPRAVAFHEDRLYWGGTQTAPLSIVASVVSSYENYDTDDATADDGLSFNIAGQVNDIEWLTSDGEFLVVGTIGGLGFVEINISGDTVSPRARFGSNFGSSRVQGIKINNQVVYLHNSTRTLYEAGYNDVSLKYESNDLSVISDDLLGSGIRYMAQVEQPDVSVYMPNDGDLKGIIRDPSQNIVGWYEYVFDGDVESVATIPSTTGEDQIWLIVKRTINGAVKRYVEYIDNSTDEIYVDSAVVYDGVATRTLTGLSHLEGETVRVAGDGSDKGEFVVSGGEITIPDTKSAVERAYIGYSYNADLEIMPIDIPIPQTGGTTQTLNSRVNEVFVLLYNTLGLEYGETFEDLRVLPFRSSGDAMDAPPGRAGAEYPEERLLTFAGNWGRSPTVCLRSSGPFPCTIVSMMVRMEVNSN